MSLVYHSQVMHQLLERARRFARSSATVLITGESGTGKELLARRIHQFSQRAQEPYLTVNCAALSETLIESELFGHEAGAFTGAAAARIGRFQATGRGTLFLDEISELPSPLQAKLLRVLEEGEFQRVGSNISCRFEGRVVAATNRDLDTEAAEGRFRFDLLHRLNVLTLHVPALRERPEDIPALVQHFIQQCQSELAQPVRGVSRDVMHRLREHPWPGNVRELRNAVLRLCLLSNTEIAESVELTPHILPFNPNQRPPAPSEMPASAGHPSILSPSDEELVPPPFDRLSLEEIERRVILFRIREHAGNKAEAAAALGVTPRTLRNKITQYRRLGYVS